MYCVLCLCVLHCVCDVFLCVYMCVCVCVCVCMCCVCVWCVLYSLGILQAPTNTTVCPSATQAKAIFTCEGIAIGSKSNGLLIVMRFNGSDSHPTDVKTPSSNNTGSHTMAILMVPAREEYEHVPVVCELHDLNSGAFERSEPAFMNFEGK